MDFTVNYKLEQAGQGIKATTVGDIEIFPPGFVQGGGKRLSLPQTTLRNLMERRWKRSSSPRSSRPSRPSSEGGMEKRRPPGTDAISVDQGPLAQYRHELRFGGQSAVAQANRRGRNDCLSLRGTGRNMRRYVDIAFDCLPLAFDPADRYSARCLAEIPRSLRAHPGSDAKHGAFNTYFLYNAAVRFT